MQRFAQEMASALECYSVQAAQSQDPPPKQPGVRGSGQNKSRDWCDAFRMARCHWKSGCGEEPYLESLPSFFSWVLLSTLATYFSRLYQTLPPKQTAIEHYKETIVGSEQFAIGCMSEEIEGSGPGWKKVNVCINMEGMRVCHQVKSIKGKVAKERHAEDVGEEILDGTRDRSDEGRVDAGAHEDEEIEEERLHGRHL